MSRPTEQQCANYEKYMNQLRALQDAVPFGEYPQFRDAVIEILIPIALEEEEEAYGCMVRSVINAMLDHMPDEHQLMECRHAKESDAEETH